MKNAATHANPLRPSQWAVFREFARIGRNTIGVRKQVLSLEYAFRCCGTGTLQ